MNRPKLENYSSRDTNHLYSRGYCDDQNKFIDQLEEEKKALIEEKESMRDSIAEIITMILKLPMLDHVGHLQEEIKRALKK